MARATLQGGPTAAMDAATRRCKLLGAPVFGVPDLLNDFGQALSRKKLLPLFRVIENPRRELTEESYCIYDAQFLVKYPKRPLVDLYQWPYLYRHLSISSANSTGERTFTSMFARLAFLSNRASVVQKQSTAAASARAKCNASKGAMP